MANTIKHKRGTTTPTAGQLVVGEVALNTTTGAAFTKTDGGSVVALNSASPAFTGNVTATGNITASGDLFGTYLKSTNSAGDEGGEILLYKAQTNTTISGTGVTIDVYQNKLRFFEQGGAARGAYIDLTAAASGVGSNLLSGGSTSAAWGSITGTLSSQTDLNTALGLKAPLASPAFTGSPTAPTVGSSDNSTAIATTAFVNSFIGGATSAASNSVIATVRNETGSTLTKGTAVYISGASSNKALVLKAQANAESTSSSTYGIVQADIANNNNGTIVISGIISGIDTSAFTVGTMLYLSPTTAGGFTTTKPTAPNHMVYIGVVAYSHANQGTIQLKIQNGYELDELHNVALTSLANNDFLVYESSTSLFKNKSIATLGLATLSSPTFTGIPSATTASNIDNSTRIATTAFVKNQNYLESSVASYTYLPLAGGTLNSNGTISVSSTGGYNGSLTGSGVSFTDSTFSNSQINSNAVFVSNGIGSTTQLTATGITFPDSTTLSTAPQILSDAPSDSQYWTRFNGAWIRGALSAYDSSIIYQLNEQVVYSGQVYQLTTYIGSSGCDPVSYSSNWTSIVGTSGGGASWGSISGSISSQSDLSSALSAKADITGASEISVSGSGGTARLGVSGSGAGAISVTDLYNTSTVTITSSGITFPDSTTLTTAGSSYSTDKIKADAITAAFTQWSGYYGMFNWYDLPKYVSNLGSSWGITDGSTSVSFSYGYSSYGQYACYFSGYLSSGTYTVYVNSTNASYSVT